MEQKRKDSIRKKAATRFSHNSCKSSRVQSEFPRRSTELHKREEDLSRAKIFTTKRRRILDQKDKETLKLEK